MEALEHSVEAWNIGDHFVCIERISLARLGPLEDTANFRNSYFTWAGFAYFLFRLPTAIALISTEFPSLGWFGVPCESAVIFVLGTSIAGFSRDREKTLHEYRVSMKESQFGLRRTFFRSIRQDLHRSF